MFDPTTAGLYIAAEGALNRAYAVSNSLGSGTLTATIYDTGAEVYSGTFTGPLTVGTNGELSVSIRPTGTASGAGTPDAATWKVRISNASGRWLEGTLGPTGRFQLSDALSIGRPVTLDALINPYGGVYVPPPPPPTGGDYGLAPLGQPRLLANASELARLQALRTSNAASWVTFKGEVDMKVSGQNRAGVSSWQIALVGALTGIDSYLDYAVTTMDAIVAEAEARIAAYVAASEWDPTRTYSAGEVVRYLGPPYKALITSTNAKPTTSTNPASWSQWFPAIANDQYLYMGSSVMDLAFTYDLARSRMTDAQRVRWYNYANQAGINAWDRRFAAWGGIWYSPFSGTAGPTPSMIWGDPTQNSGGVQGWGVHNPVDNYYYRHLIGTLFLGIATYGENPMATQWLDWFRIDKMQNELIPAYTAELVGGGSREGTGYGVAMGTIWLMYYWWQVATGESIQDINTHARDSIKWWAHTVTPKAQYAVATGDHSGNIHDAKLDFNDSLYFKALIRLYPNLLMSGAAKTLQALMITNAIPNTSLYTYAGARVNDFLFDPTPVAAQPLSTFGNAVYASGTGFFATRTDWTQTATYFATLCGPYTQNHLHQEQGSIHLFSGEWLILPANSMSNTGIIGGAGDTFGTVKNNVHRFVASGVPVKQAMDKSQSITAASDSQYYSYALCNTTPIYSLTPAVTKSERELVFIRPDCAVVFDRLDNTGAGYERIWTITVPSLPSVVGGNLETTGALGNKLTVFRTAPEGLSYGITNWRAEAPTVFSRDAWRIDVPHSAGNSTRFLHVLGVNDAVTTAVASDASGQTGVLITFADGGTATVRFSTAGTGGTIDLRDSGNSVLVAETFTTTVDL